MKKTIFFALASSLLLLASCSKEPASLPVMSFNVRCASANDGEYSWPHRRDAAFIKEVVEIADSRGSDFFNVVVRKDHQFTSFASTNHLSSSLKR